MGETFADLVTDGPLLVAAAVAALVGLISFASPCVLPLVPGYLSYVTGLVGSGAQAATARTTAAPAGTTAAGGATATAVRTDERAPRGRMVLGAVLFVSGFTAVFVAITTAFGGLGRLLLVHNEVITQVMGGVTVLVGLGFLGWLPLLQRTKRLTVRPTVGLAGAPLLGVVFGLGWTPCLGPTLAAVQNLAFAEATAGRGALLGLAYCLGLGVPFVLVALGARWAVGATTFLRVHARTVTRVGGAVLVLVGLLLLTGAWTEMMQWLRSWLATSGFAETSL
ncbi:cytochrome c biogenesis CcdA family protein [Blastococcus sp. SYSU D01042]